MGTGLLMDGAVSGLYGVIRIEYGLPAYRTVYYFLVLVLLGSILLYFRFIWSCYLVIFVAVSSFVH